MRRSSRSTSTIVHGKTARRANDDESRLDRPATKYIKAEHPAFPSSSLPFLPTPATMLDGSKSKWSSATVYMTFCCAVFSFGNLLYGL